MCLAKKIVIVFLSSVFMAGLFVGASHAAVPDGFLGVPWGASRDQIIKTMNERGFTTQGAIGSADRPPSTLVFRGAFADQACQLEFYLMSNALYKGRASHLGLLQPPGAQLALYRQMVKQIGVKYGPPQSDNVQEDKTNTGEIWRAGKAEWNFTDGEAAEKYKIGIDLIPPVMYFSNYNKSLGYVFITYTAVSLEERLKMKEY